MNNFRIQSFSISVEIFEKILVKPRSLSFFLSLLSPLTLLLCFGHGRAARCALPLPVPLLRPLPAMSASSARPADLPSRPVTAATRLPIAAPLTQLQCRSATPPWRQASPAARMLATTAARLSLCRARPPLPSLARL